MKALNDFIPKNHCISIPGKKTGAEGNSFAHIFQPEDCLALWAAYAAGRPLLVRGKPGTGKSQMARAIAEQLGWAFVEEVISGNAELSDLHYHFDAIGRLGEAQTLGMLPPAQSKAEKHQQTSGSATIQDDNAGCDNSALDQLNPLRFLAPGAFWWAWNWKSADQQYQRCATRLRSKPRLPDSNPNWNAENDGVVLLLDEIDKAEPDLPNGLLETLGSYQFSVPYLDSDKTMESLSNPITADPKKLLIIVTSNEERELPQAFVRRCFVHTLNMKQDPAWLVQRGQLHFADAISESVYLNAAEMLLKDRQDNPHGQYPPGLAEYIDLLRILAPLPKKEQQQRLDKVAEFALKKELRAEDEAD